MTIIIRRGVIVFEGDNPVGIILDTPRGIRSEHVLPAGQREMHPRTISGAADAFRNAGAEVAER